MDTPTPCRLMMPSELKLNVELELSMYARMTSSGTPETAILRISRAGGESLADASEVAIDTWGLATSGASSVCAPAASGKAADKARMISLERFIKFTRSQRYFNSKHRVFNKVPFAVRTVALLKPCLRTLDDAQPKFIPPSAAMASAIPGRNPKWPKRRQWHNWPSAKLGPRQAREAGRRWERRAGHSAATGQAQAQQA